MSSWIDRHFELQAASEADLPTYAMRQIFDEFLFALNSGERAFVLDMLHHLVIEEVEPRPGNMNPFAAARLRHYLMGIVR